MQQIWKTQQWPQDWKRSVIVPIPKKGNAKDFSNYCTIALISHASIVMLKILQARLQQYMNFQMFKLDLEKAEEPEIKWPKSAGSSKTWEFQKNIYFCFIDYIKAFDCGLQETVENSTRDGIPDHLTCLLRNLYAGKEQQLELTWNNRVLPNWERSMSRLYIVTLLI